MLATQRQPWAIPCHRSARSFRSGGAAHVAGGLHTTAHTQHVSIELPTHAVCGPAAMTTGPRHKRGHRHTGQLPGAPGLLSKIASATVASARHDQHIRGLVVTPSARGAGGHQLDAGRGPAPGSRQHSPPSSSPGRCHVTDPRAASGVAVPPASQEANIPQPTHTMSASSCRPMRCAARDHDYRATA